MTLENSQKSGSRLAPSLLIVAAWLVTLVASSLPAAIWNQFAGPTPPWLLWAKAALVAVSIVIAWAWKRVRPLRSYFILLLVQILVWWLVDWIRTTTPWSQSEGRVPWVVGLLGIQLLKAGAATLTIIVLLLVVHRRADAFLVKGQLDARVEPVRWLGLKGDGSWKVVAPIVAVAAGAIMFVVLAMANGPSATTLLQGLPLLPAALLFSATNAFSEEVSFRSSLLAPLHQVIGKGPAMAVTSVFFGLAHYAGGVPLATLPTVLMTGFLGWWMAKSMLESKGFFWPWFIHLVADIPVFFFLAMRSLA